MIDHELRIAGHDRLAPFLMSIPSACDLWMFISSAGGLAAGRVDPEGSLFPYDNVDRLHDGHHHTGPITLLRVRRGAGPPALWQPLTARPDGGARIERNLFKNTVGNRLTFEEIHHDLGLVFRQRWSPSDAFGWVRTVTLANRGTAAVSVDVLDGLRNVLPHGASLELYQQSSSLVDAYKRSEIDGATGLGIYSLTSKILDRPVAAEELRANVVWSHGLPNARVHVGIEAVEAFRRGEPIAESPLRTGRRGHHLVDASLPLAPGAEARWHVVADAGLGHVEVAALRARLRGGGDLDAAIETSLDEERDCLVGLVASADGLQRTAEPATVAHHFANVLFNVMRGGVFDSNHEVPADDFRDFVRSRNHPTARRHDAWLRVLPGAIDVTELLARARATGDADLERLALEYLPLYFGRRHGDPSRPWNRFRIQVRNADGTRALRYEGNWRDIFQNWEALAVSFPSFLPGMVARFVNASTPDGFNPYRVTRDGFDWETIDPQHPWSGIGYWGDHQVVYLLRLLEALERTAPGDLGRLLDRAIFTYADVPYRLAAYDALLADPRDTIAFDDARAARVAERVAAMGGDGKLVPAPGDGIVRVNLLEKLLVPALSKLSNLVADGGIWMNTQRPEWNDANNALVGDGLSVVTLGYLRRYLVFVERLIEERGDAVAAISGAVARWLRRVREVLEERRGLLAAAEFAAGDRRRLLDNLGRAFSAYRDEVEHDGLGAATDVAAAEITALCRIAVAHLDHAIAANRRDDGLYHAYNLLALQDDPPRAAVRHLDTMLEGQVAALSSGLVSPGEAVGLIERLFDSPLYRIDQNSFLLYPERELPGFLDKNRVPPGRVDAIPLLGALIAAGVPSILSRDAEGAFRFHADLRNAADLAIALDRLAARAEWATAVARDRAKVLDVFEEVFQHGSFTGRSGTMYGYEGLGCIYWHMVAKLLLAVQEQALRAVHAGEPEETRRALADLYERIRGGLGPAKTPEEFGAFPTDPYSHTPRHAGAQQPGMTGQVKEEILTRFGELGVEVEHGRVRFRPALLRHAEFLRDATTFVFLDVGGGRQEIALPPGSLAFTYCQVPVVYTLAEKGPAITVAGSDGSGVTGAGDRLDEDDSRAVLGRRGVVTRIDVRVPASSLRG